MGKMGDISIWRMIEGKDGKDSNEKDSEKR